MNSKILTAVSSAKGFVDEHRKQERLTCRTNCWCWEVEKIVLAIEEAGDDDTPETEPDEHPWETDIEGDDSDGADDQDDNV